MESSTSVRDLEDRVAKLQRAVYYLIWKRTGFGEQCVHCGHAYPAHAERCKAAGVGGLGRRRPSRVERCDTGPERTERGRPVSCPPRALRTRRTQRPPTTAK